MVSNNDDDQKLRWQKMKKDLQDKLNQKERVKTSRFDELTSTEGLDIINKREYPAGAESILVEAENNKKDLDNSEIKKLAGLQASIKKISEVLKKNTITLKHEEHEHVSSALKELTQNISKDNWDQLNIYLKIIQQGEQPEPYEELENLVENINAMMEPQIDLFLNIIENTPDDYNFSIILSSSFLVAVKCEGNDNLKLLIIRFSKSKKKLILLFMDELPNEKEKKELLVSFLLGQNTKFIIAHKEAKKIAFQRSIANKKLKN